MRKRFTLLSKVWICKTKCKPQKINSKWWTICISVKQAELNCTPNTTYNIINILPSPLIFSYFCIFPVWSWYEQIVMSLRWGLLYINANTVINLHKHTTQTWCAVQMLSRRLTLQLLNKCINHEPVRFQQVRPYWIWYIIFFGNTYKTK